MIPKLSVVIPTHNDNEECGLTVASILETSPREVEVIVIDDASPMAFMYHHERVRVIRNEVRAGAGASRHVGMLEAQGLVSLLCDSHMRFEAGWYEKASHRFLGQRNDILFCASCCGFTRKHPPFGKPNGQYYGATFDWKKFDGVWGPEVENDAEIQCLMGACYFIPTEWYWQNGGLQHLRDWGSEEMLLSLKAWMSGAEIRLMKDVRIWHRFRDNAERVPYRILTWHVLYNKMFLIHTLFPDKADKLMKYIRVSEDSTMARRQLNLDWNLVIAERARNHATLDLLKDFDWLCEKFGLGLP